MDASVDEVFPRPIPAITIDAGRDVMWSTIICWCSLGLNSIWFYALIVSMIHTIAAAGTPTMAAIIAAATTVNSTEATAMVRHSLISSKFILFGGSPVAGFHCSACCEELFVESVSDLTRFCNILGVGRLHLLFSVNVEN